MPTPYDARVSDLFSEVDTPELAPIPTLSDEQRVAVEHDAGPLIVLAGPGTGKTRVITARVAHLVRERRVEPSTVLAVTFTNKAAGELRQRMFDLIRPSDAAAIRAGTMHGYGMQLLRRFGDMLGLPREIEILDSAQERRLARDLIRAHGLFRSSMGRGIEAAIDRGLRVSKELINLGIAPSQAIDDAQAAGENLGADGHDAALRAELSIFVESARFASLLDDACFENGTPRFDDLIRWPIRLLRTSELARDIVRQQCRHVVVDEFQDLNATQIELLAALCPPEADTGRCPDVCVVGDDDQSIYAFRGADERAFERFSTRWGGQECVETVRLTTNYRSGTAVIDASNAIIGGSVYRFAPDKKGCPGPNNPPSSSVELVRMAKDTDSPQTIAGMLRADLDREPALDLSRVAVIGRTNGELRQIGAAFDAEGVPFVTSVDDASREDPGVRLLLNWCELLIDPTRSWAARAVLTRAPFRCDPAALGTIEQRYRAERSRAEENDEGAQDPGAFLAWAVTACAGQQPLCDALERAAALEHAIGVAINGVPADDALMRIVRETGVANAEDLQARERAARVRSIVALVRFARERIDRIGEPRDLRALLAYLEDLPEREKSFAKAPENVIASGVDEGPESGVGVRLLTAHASKGLEFDTVYIARVCPGWGFPKTQGGDDELVPECVAGADPNGRGARERLLDEERRVFFVALTRAERRAVLLGKPPKKPGASVHYPLELRGADGIELIERDAADVLSSARTGAHQDELDAIERDRLDSDHRASVLHVARRSARRDAAEALDLIQRHADPTGEAAGNLGLAADRLALVSHVEQTGCVPEWAEARGLADEAARLLDRLRIGSEPNGSTFGATMSPPLRLSYTAINSYQRCPRCFYVNRVLGLEQKESAALALGKSVHGALETFTTAWRDADSEGVTPPGWDDLERMTRQSFFSSWPRGLEVDHHQLQRSLAQTRVYWEHLHDPNAHVLEIERSFEIPFVVDGIAHKIRGKIDRIDLMESTGGRRVIDYKTGHPSKELLGPKSTDLQLAIYSMGLAHMDGLAVDGPADEQADWSDGSVGEYWLLSSGEVGSIALSALKLDRVRTQIEESVRGMLAGRFEQGSRCSGDCDFLDDAGPLGL